MDRAREYPRAGADGLLARPEKARRRRHRHGHGAARLLVGVRPSPADDAIPGRARARIDAVRSRLLHVELDLAGARLALHGHAARGAPGDAEKSEARARAAR